MQRAQENSWAADENSWAAAKSTNPSGLGMGNNNRRRLRDIGNVVAAPPYNCAASKSKIAPAGDKNPHGFVARRPITRKFAASLAGKSQDSERAPRKEPATIEDHRSSDSSSGSAVVDQYGLPDDFPLPMIEEIEEMVNCENREVEMEDLDDGEPVVDIDGGDSKNPLAVVDYVGEIYSFYRKSEELGCVPSNYMSNQYDINEKMRAILIDWLIEVHYKFELMDETLFLTVNIIDRFLAQQTVVRKKLQLVGVTSLLLACKYEEVTVPVVEDLILISDRAYTREDVLEMEKLIINTLKFNMSVPTPYVFMRRFLKASQSSKKMELLSSFITELCLVEYSMLRFRPSLLAAAAVYTAQATLEGFKHWSRTSELHSTYTEDQLLECSRLMVDFHQKAGIGKLTGVHRKYNTSKFGFTAKIGPALFLFDEEF